MGAGADAVPLDSRFVAIISDIHIPLPWSEQKYRTGREYPWIIDTVKRHIAEILACNPRPARVISLGDMSIAFGETREYVLLRELLKPLYDAGIEVTLAMGNHDIRAEFLQSFPEYAAKSLVPGRFVYKVETPDLDFLVLDSLKEPTKRGSYAAVTGSELGKAQMDWLQETLKTQAKPTIVCAHHSAQELKLVKLLTLSPHVFGYLHGHHHHWMTNLLFPDYRDNAPSIRSVGVGSFGIDRDVGYALLRTAPTFAQLKVVAKDYYFPGPLPREKRPPLWDDSIRDAAPRKFRFPFAK